MQFSNPICFIVSILLYHYKDTCGKSIYLWALIRRGNMQSLKVKVIAQPLITCTQWITFFKRMLHKTNHCIEEIGKYSFVAGSAGRDLQILWDPAESQAKSALQHIISCGEEPAGLLMVLNYLCCVYFCPTM